MEKLKILIGPGGKIPVTKYGGIERVVWNLGKELAAIGHQVTFLANKGSHCDFASIIEYDPKLKLSVQIPVQTDLFHAHAPVWEELPIPHMVTLHGNSRPNRAFNINTTFVSKNHAARYGSDVFIHNGIDLEDYGKAQLNNPRHYLHFLGRAGWRVKNLKGSVDIARKSNNHLRVLGGNRVSFDMGFKIYTDRHVRFEGMVGGDRKNKLINDSKALLFPVTWHEPLGLAIIESLYFGCPVFGTPYGSLPELITPEFGFLSDKKTEIVDALKHIDQYDRKKCHEYVCDKFTSKQMAENYLLLYEKVMNGQKLNSAPPKLLDPDHIDKLPLFD